MSIRVKLLLSYLIMIILPLGLVVSFLHLLFHLFVGNLEEMKDYYNVEEPFVEELLTEDLLIYTNLQSYVKENPEAFRNPGILKQYEQQLSKRKAVLLVREDEGFIYQSEKLEEDLLSTLSQQTNSTGSAQGYLSTNEATWLYTSTDFFFDDGNKGTYFLLLDIGLIDSFIRVVVPTLIITFILAFLVTSGILTYVVSKHIIDPLKELKEAANRMKEGELEPAIIIKRKDEIGELSDALEEMRVRLIDSVEKQLKYEKNRRELINNISHDLKTPITSIKGYVEGIMDGVANDREKLEKYCRTIHVKATHMDHLIDELFLFSKLDMNSVAFFFEKVDIQEFLENMIEEMKLDFEKQKIEVTLDNKLTGEPFIKADREKLERVIRNILANSIKFFDKEKKQLSLSLEKSDPFILLIIKDNGQGIKKENLAHVLDRFYKGDSSRNTENGGSGIGLAIAKQIVEAHGGTISIESTYGEGTTIYLSLKQWK
ncbi:sensor histidine kinase [Gracilibacillus xinjiangensis]|uniref:histidine kinase n=1 Tax=Gracilibacillus xinjiangensis TaxID=1193282 RepID=A0ABV8WRP3_9BACI